MEGDRTNFVLKHLFVWLHALNRSLDTAISQRRQENASLQRHAGNLAELNAQHAGQLLRKLQGLVAEGPQFAAPLMLNPKEDEIVAGLAGRHGLLLPLHRLAEQSGLCPFEIAALVICAAPHVDSAYGRIYGYLMDDLAQHAPSLALIMHLAGEQATGIAVRRRMLAPGGLLRRLGLVHAANPLSDDPATQMVPASGLADWLTGATGVPPVQLDDLRLLVPTAADSDACTGELARAAQGMRNCPAMLAGLWSGDLRLHEDQALAIAAGAGMRLYRAQTPLDEGGQFGGSLPGMAKDLAVAASAHAIYWLECNPLLDGPPERREGVVRLLAGRPQRLLLSGSRHWRPPELIASRPCLEIDGTQLSLRSQAWTRDLAGIGLAAAAALDSEYCFSRSHRRAAINLATAGLTQPSSGDGAALTENLRRACGIVSAPDGGRSAMVVEPRRTLDDLILPSAIHNQIAEIARLYRNSAMVDRDWGFGRISGSSGAIKVLFTGDPGTGKTLAAEAIAAACGMHLLRVDLSQIVSKWIGETEKNLEEVFGHAEQNHSVLFFDEAEALFGKRGEVRHGTDRYANMEVSYLLQRLEAFGGGVVILSSNLRDEIDPAFTRRFQVAVNFPRPGETERRRIWELVFAAAPLGHEVSLETLAKLELTGGGIVTAARMAALLAASEDAPTIGAVHLRMAIERQFSKEARLLHGSGQYDGLHVARGLR